MSRVWLITGCSTGIGRAIAIEALAAGHLVAVTARNPDDVANIVAPYPDTALSLALDVSDEAAVADAFAATKHRFGPVEVLVNNAGYGYVSSIEEGDEAKIKALFDVNFFGVLRTLRHALPDMRAARAGRVITISSLAGRISNPATGFYSASKFALEAMSEALSREVAELGIHVTAIAPGMFLSDFSGRSLKAQDTAIGDYSEGAHARMELVKSADGLQPGDPAKLAAMVLEVSEMDDPPRQLIAGPDAYAAISARMDEVREAMERHRDWSSSTDFER